MAPGWPGLCVFGLQAALAMPPASHLASKPSLCSDYGDFLGWSEVTMEMLAAQGVNVDAYLYK